MKGFGQQNKFNKRKTSDFKTYQSNAQILNQALIFQSQGNISQAKKYYKYLIDGSEYNKKLRSKIISIFVAFICIFRK